MISQPDHDILSNCLAVVGSSCALCCGFWIVFICQLCEPVVPLVNHIVNVAVTVGLERVAGDLCI